MCIMLMEPHTMCGRAFSVGHLVLYNAHFPDPGFPTITQYLFPRSSLLISITTSPMCKTSGQIGGPMLQGEMSKVDQRRQN